MPDIVTAIWYITVFAVTISIELYRRFNKPENYNWVYKSILTSGLTVMASIAVMVLYFLYLPLNAFVITVLFLASPALFYLLLRKAVS